MSRNGAPVNGVIEAYDEFEAVAAIKRSCDVVTYIREVEPAQVGGKPLFGAQKVKAKPLAMVCSQFAIILSSGLPIVRAVELIADQTADKTLKKILKSVAEDVAAGHSLAQSFENKGGKQLPTTFIETVRAGEESGTLDTSFDRLHRYYDKSSKIRGKVKSAMTYPILLCIVAVIVVAIIMTVAVPVFSTTFASMGTELPGVTKALIGMSNFFTEYGIVLIGVIIVLIIAGKAWGKTEKGKLAFGKLKLKLPVLGKVTLMNGASQFANTMSTMMASGLSMVKAVTITGRVMANYALGLEVLDTVSGIEEGGRLGDCMKKSKHFPELLVEMTAVGEETGSLEDTLDVIGEYYDNEAELSSSRALALLEPLITIVLAVFVVFVLLSIYLPMFSMYDGIG